MPAPTKAPKPKPAATPAAAPSITATATECLNAIRPIATIVEEKWPLGFQGGYWVGKLLQKLQAEEKAIEAGRQALLREYAEVTDEGIVAVHADGSAVFATGQFQRYKAKLDEELAKPRVIDGARPIRTSDLSHAVREKLKKEQISGAMLGLLSGTPFLVEDVPLFDEP